MVSPNLDTEKKVAESNMLDWRGNHEDRIAALDKRLSLLEQAFLNQNQIASQTLQEIKGMRTEMQQAAQLAAVHNDRLTTLVGADGTGGAIRELWKSVDSLKWRLAMALGGAVVLGSVISLAVEWMKR